MSTGSAPPNDQMAHLDPAALGFAPAVHQRDVRLLAVVRRRGRRRGQPEPLDPGLVAPQAPRPGRRAPRPPPAPRPRGDRSRRRPRPRRTGRSTARDRSGRRLQGHQVDPAHAERLQGERQHPRPVVDQHDDRGLVAGGAGLRRGERRGIGAGEGEESGLVGGVVLDPLGEGTRPWASAAWRAAMAASAGFPSRATISALPAVSHALTSSTSGRCCREPEAALAQRDGVRQHPPDAGEGGPRDGHQRVVHRERISWVSRSVPSPNASSRRS